MNLSFKIYFNEKFIHNYQHRVDAHSISKLKKNPSNALKKICPILLEKFSSMSQNKSDGRFIFENIDKNNNFGVVYWKNFTILWKLNKLESYYASHHIFRDIGTLFEEKYISFQKIVIFCLLFFTTIASLNFMYYLLQLNLMSQ